MSGDEVQRTDTPIISVEDDMALLTVVEQLFPSLFGITLTPVPGDALAAETEVGTLIVGVLGDFVVSLEMRLHGEFEATAELLAELNDRNASTSFVTFSILEGALWASASVDGNPLVPAHLARVVAYLAQSAALLAESRT
jgi:hypothetical protein